jgi:hypothetical protein
VKYVVFAFNRGGKRFRQSAFIKDSSKGTAALRGLIEGILAGTGAENITINSAKPVGPFFTVEVVQLNKDTSEPGTRVFKQDSWLPGDADVEP